MTPPHKTASTAPSSVASAPSTHVKRSPNAARPQTAEERRRAQRVLLRMPILVRLTGKANPLSAVMLTVAGVVGGVLGRDYWLTVQVMTTRRLATRPAGVRLLAR